MALSPSPPKGGEAAHQGELANLGWSLHSGMEPLCTGSRQIITQYTKTSVFLCLNHRKMSQDPDKIFLLIAVQWEIYFEKEKLFLRITFIVILIPDLEMGQLSSRAAKGIFEKYLNKCKVTNLPLAVLTH